MLPDEQLVTAIEKRIDMEDCFDLPVKWQKEFFFAQDSSGSTVRDTVRFLYREAGAHGFIEGKRIVSARDVELAPDSRTYSILAGTYQINSGSLQFDVCGRNSTL